MTNNHHVCLVIDLFGDPGAVEAVTDSVISSISFMDLESCDIEVLNDGEVKD